MGMPKVDQGESDVYIGDMAIAFEYCQAAQQSLNLSSEAYYTHIFLHGFLHLLGFDHITPKDQTLMRTVENHVMHILGLGKIWP